jgi:serine/threonine-protein kinase
VAPKTARDPLEALASGESIDEAAAIAALARARGTSFERSALDFVLRAHFANRASEALETRAAEIFIQRGERDRALELLQNASSVPSLLLAADAYAERGEAARALVLVERVLARDIDAPGARERHERLREAIGGASPALRKESTEPTVLRAEEPETPFRIVGEAGRGGAGTVYEAIDDALGRRVALKVYHRPAEDSDKLEREARTAVDLASRGVVRVYDVDLERGFLVMEWLSGGALKHWLLRDPAPLWPIEGWLVPLLTALSRVHARDVVHGDLKPANVMFRTMDQPVVSDFGLARPVGEALVGGSVGYMSPERLERSAASLDEDVFAIGRVLEDALEAFEREKSHSPSEIAHWRPAVTRLLAPRGKRPKNASVALDFVRSIAGAPERAP